MEDFDIPARNPSEEAQRRWRSDVSVVRNRRRRFRMVADLVKKFDRSAAKTKILLKDFDIPAKNPSGEAQRRWRSAVRNRPRGFGMVADLVKRFAAKTKILKTQKFLHRVGSVAPLPMCKSAPGWRMRGKKGWLEERGQASETQMISSASAASNPDRQTEKVSEPSESDPETRFAMSWIDWVELLLCRLGLEVASGKTSWEGDSSHS